MKTLKLFAAVIALLWITSANQTQAQTFQNQMVVTENDLMAWCLNRSITGQFVYHFSYHLDRKTGKIDNIHWNILHTDIRDSETGERYIFHDCGSDRLGYWWDFYNNPNSSNGIPDLYNVEDGWLDDYMPEELPKEGTMIGMNFRFNARGMMLNWSTLIQLHMNSDGKVTAEVYKEVVNCN
jgi:hypothetical protein